MNSVVAEKKWIQERLGIPYQSLSQSFLRAETQLGALSQYSFFLQRGQVASPIVTENLLELNDQFIITHTRISLRRIAVVSGSPTATQQLAAQQYLYADPIAFTANSANAAAIYGGNLSFTIDRTQFLPAFPVNYFYRVPQTQTQANLQSSWTSGAGVTSYIGNTGVNSYENGLFGFAPSEPTLIDGRQTLDINLNLGAGVNMVDSNVFLYATFETRGYLVVNSKS